MFLMASLEEVNLLLPPPMKVMPVALLMRAGTIYMLTWMCGIVKLPMYLSLLGSKMHLSMRWRTGIKNWRSLHLVLMMLTILPVEALRKIIFSAHMYGRRIGFTTQAVTTHLASFFHHELEQLRRANLMMLMNEVESGQNISSQCPADSIELRFLMLFCCFCCGK